MIKTTRSPLWRRRTYSDTQYRRPLAALFRQALRAARRAAARGRNARRPERRITYAHALVVREALTEILKVYSRVSWRGVKRDYAAFDQLGRFIAGDVAEVFIIKARQALA